MPAATAAAEPADDPPGTRSSAQGLAIGQKAEFSPLEPIANSSMFVLPSITNPASSSRSITVASYGGTNGSRIFEPHVVRTSFVHMLSLMAQGMPVSGPPLP